MDFKLKVWFGRIMLLGMVSAVYFPMLAGAVNEPPSPALSMTGSHVVVNDDDHHAGETPQDDIWDKNQPGITDQEGNYTIPNEGLRVVGKRLASDAATGGTVATREEPDLKLFTIDATYIQNCPGTLTVTVEGNDGNVKFWEDEEEDEDEVDEERVTPFGFVTKDDVTSMEVTVSNSLSGELKFWVEGIKPTEGFDTITITAVYSVTTNAGSGITTGTIKFGVVRADVDVDTLNIGDTSEVEATNVAGVDADSSADQKELSLTEEVFGKLLFPNLGDEDGDGVQNAADGIQELGGGEAGQVKFEKVVIHHDKPWSEDAVYSFNYELSEPKEGAGLTGGGTIPNDTPETTDDKKRWTVVKRGMRLWLKDGDTLRYAGSAAEGQDLIYPDTPVTWADLKTRASLSGGATKITLFVEYVTPDAGGDSATRQPIEVTVKDDPKADKGKVEIDGVSTAPFSSPEAPDGANVTLLPVEISSSHSSNEHQTFFDPADDEIYRCPDWVANQNSDKMEKNALVIYHNDAPKGADPAKRYPIVKFSVGGQEEIEGLSWSCSRKSKDGHDFQPAGEGKTTWQTGGGAANGGLYRYHLEGSEYYGNVWLPLAGPDISSFWESEITYFKTTWKDAYSAKLRRLSEPFQNSTILMVSFWTKQAAADMARLGQTLDWNDSERILKDYAPTAGLRNSGNARYTCYERVLDLRKSSNMMYALIGRCMGLEEAILSNAGDPGNWFGKYVAGATGTPDSPAAKESYQAGFDLFDGTSLEDVMISRGEKMQEPNSWAQKEWPSEETSTGKLKRTNEQLLQEIIQ